MSSETAIDAAQSSPGSKGGTTEAREAGTTETHLGGGSRTLGAVSRVARSYGEVLFPLAVLMALVVFLSTTSPHFLTQANLANLLGEASVLAIVAFGATFVIISGNFDLSVGAGVALVGMASALVMVNTDSVALGIVTAFAVGVGLGLVNGLLVAWLLVPSFIATLAMLVIARGVSLALTDGRPVTQLPGDFMDFMSTSFLGLTAPTWIALAVVLVLLVVLHRTRLGVEIFAVGGNAEAARLSGVPVRTVRTVAFMIGGVTVAIAGLVLIGRLGTAQPNAAQLLELMAIAAVVLGGTSLYGGRGSVAWTAVGVLLIVVIQNGLTLKNISTDIQMIVLGTIFIVAALWGVVRARLS